MRTRSWPATGPPASCWPTSGDPEAILGHPKTRALIDFSQPVGLLLVAILHFITEAEKPPRILATLWDALPEGSYLVLSHATAELRPEAAQSAADIYDRATSTVTLRSKTQIGHRQGPSFSGDLEASWIALPGLAPVSLLEHENDLIAAHVLTTGHPPAAQFLG
jgi:hypothetical protein